MVDRQELFKAFKLMLNPYSCNYIGHNVTTLLPTKTTIITAMDLMVAREDMETIKDKEIWATVLTRAIIRTKAIIKEGTIRVIPLIIKAT